MKATRRSLSGFWHAIGECSSRRAVSGWAMNKPSDFRRGSLFGVERGGEWSEREGAALGFCSQEHVPTVRDYARGLAPFIAGAA
jgi:hypothetical protein